MHTSDLHLERPLGGVAQVPAHLRERFLDAPFEAAAQVFETALSERADALLLAGDVVDFDLVGPRAVVFLQEQFQRLAEHDIPVYWACGDVDPAEAWPASVPLPENVTIFPVGRAQEFELCRGGEVIAKIQGISRNQGSQLDDSGFHRDAHGLFTVGVSYGTSAAPGTEGDRVHYMALGGMHHRQTVDQSPGIAHYCGSPQGRTPTETEAHGCTLVTVDDSGQVKTSFMATDSLRWITETVEVTAGTDEDALMAQLQARISKLQTKHSGSRLLITWRIEGSGKVLNHMRRGGISDQMVELLCGQYGHSKPEIWTVGIECQAPLDVPQEWIDEETIMGDMLREFRALEADVDIPLQLEEFLPEQLLSTPRAELATVAEQDRAGLLWAASKMAVDLLDGEEEITCQ
ncbi:MAG: metallophosphoesterase family protein, partial [Bythopirellula sp.]